jgi:hypothetical protein
VGRKVAVVAGVQAIIAQIANYHKLRNLIDEWIDTAIDLDRLRRNQAR